MAEACSIIQAIYEEAVSENPDVIVTCRGGPIVEPKDLQICLDETDVHGFIGGSSIERIPVERAIFHATKKFLNMHI